MSKRRLENQGQPDAMSARPKNLAPQMAAGVRWHSFWRSLVSLLLVLHLTAVFAAPWDLSTEPALPPDYLAPTDAQGRSQPDSADWQQPLVPRGLRSFFHHYLNLAYLNHGYQFFAPDPAGSNLIRYQVWDSGGAEIAAGTFPDLKEQWPRLLYHRHMMLAAQTLMMGPESGHRYAKHLLRIHGGQSAHLKLVLHKLLSPQEALGEKPLDAESTYVVLAEIRETADATGEAPIAIPRIGQ